LFKAGTDDGTEVGTEAPDRFHVGTRSVGVAETLRDTEGGRSGFTNVGFVGEVASSYIEWRLGATTVRLSLGKRWEDTFGCNVVNLLTVDCGFLGGRVLSWIVSFCTGMMSLS
jgi:hypothetical protein